MKNILKIVLLSIGVAGLAACSQDSVGGNESPNVIISQYKPGDGYNSDNDVKLRVTANSAVDSVWIMVETAEQHDAHVKELGESGYAKYIAEEGTALDLSTSEFDNAKVWTDVVKDLKGEHIITAAAVGNGEYVSSSTSFTGRSWSDFAIGTYTSCWRGAIENVKLQSCDQDPELYQFVSLFKEGFNIRFNIYSEETGEYGDYYTITVPSQETGLDYGNYGAVSIMDVSTWQSDKTYAAENVFDPELKILQIWAAYLVPAGALTYNYDTFVANK